MTQLGVDLDFREGPVEVLFCFLKGAARSELDNLDRIVFPVFIAADFVHLSKSAGTDNPLVLKIGLKALS